MKTKAQILARMRELEGNLTSEELTKEDLRIDWMVRDYYMNLGRTKALNWVLNKD